METLDTDGVCRMSPALVTHYRSRDMLHVTASHCIRPDTSWVMPGLFNTVCNILQSPDISGHTLVMTGPRKWCWVQSPEIWEILILITAWECHNTGGEEPPTSPGEVSRGERNFYVIMWEWHIIITDISWQPWEVTRPGVTLIWLLFELIPALLCSVDTPKLHGDTDNLSAPYLTSPKTIFTFLWQYFSHLVRCRCSHRSREVAWDPPI